MGYLLFALLLALPAVVVAVTIAVGRDLVRMLRTPVRPRPQRLGFLVAALVVLLADLAAMAVVWLRPSDPSTPSTPKLVLVFVSSAGLFAVAAVGKVLHLLATPRAARSREVGSWLWFLIASSFAVGSCYGVMVVGGA